MPLEITRLGVIGAGQMGNGISHVCALAGLPVVLLDAKAEALDKTMAAMAKNMERQVGKGTISAEDKMAALARITHHDRLRGVRRLRHGDRGGDREGRRQARDLPHADPASGPDCILASNTSSISITRLGAATDRPGKFIGMHFMNPVPVMKLVEVIRGIATDEPTFQAVQALATGCARRRRRRRTSRASSSTACWCR